MASETVVWMVLRLVAKLGIWVARLADLLEPLRVALKAYYMVVY